MDTALDADEEDTANTREVKIAAVAPFAKNFLPILFNMVRSHVI